MQTASAATLEAGKNSIGKTPQREQQPLLAATRPALEVQF
jgi:hypothetical protein